MSTVARLDSIYDRVFQSQQSVVDAFGKFHGRLPSRVRNAKLPLATRLIDPRTLVDKTYAPAQRVLGDTESGKLVARQKQVAVSLAEHVAPHFGKS